MGKPAGSVLRARLHLPRAGRREAWLDPVRVTESPKWIVANTAGWAATMPVIFVGATVPTTETPIAMVGAVGALTGAFAGAVLGAITARWVARLRPRRGA